MFSKIFIALSTLTVLAVGIPTAAPAPSQCNTSGAPVCCNGYPTLQQAQAQTLLGLIGVPISLITANAALGCTPVSVVGGGVDCSQKPVCCTQNTQNGLVNVQCVPVTL